MPGSSAEVSKATSTPFDPFAQISQAPWQQLDLSRDSTAGEALPEFLPENLQLSVDHADDTYISSADPNASKFLLSRLLFEEQTALNRTLSSVLHDDAVVTVQTEANQQRRAKAASEGTVASSRTASKSTAAAAADVQDTQLLDAVISADPHASDFLVSCLNFQEQTRANQSLASVLHDDAVVTLHINTSQTSTGKADCSAASAPASDFSAACADMDLPQGG